MSEYYYYIEDDKLYRFRIETDNEPWNPRFDMDGNIGDLNLWWNRYMLGDNKGKGDPYNILDDLVREHVPESDLIKKALEGNLVIPKYIYNKKDKEYIASKGEGYTYYVPEDEFVEEIISELSNGRAISLLSQYIVIMPCFIYEHSGMTISCSNAGYPFNDRWDSGCAGFIYTTKEMCEKEWGQTFEDDSWKERASKELENEIDFYDMYLKGECYGYILEEYKDGEWINSDSCWGYYSDKWDEELAREIANDGITGEPFISEEEAEEYMKELDVMEQADTIVCI